MSQRYVDLGFSISEGMLTVQGPTNGAEAPPGYYMMFVVNSEGVPSEARFIQVNTSGSRTRTDHRHSQ